MATWQGLAQSIIEFHEKVNYSENTAIRGRVLNALVRAVAHLWSKADWSFKTQMIDQFVYEPSIDSNPLPDNFLSFQGTGRVILLQADDVTPRRNLLYVPFNRILELLKSQPVSYTGTPECYSLGGPLDGGGNQRSLFLYPRPASAVSLRLVYQAAAPTVLLANWTEEIPCIPVNWHTTVIEEIAILFRLMDKSADITAQTSIVSTAVGAMMRDEPHGREDSPQMTPAYGWRMNVRY